jgi:hypothetical protein
MRQRDFIAAVGGLAAARPAVARTYFVRVSCASTMTGTVSNSAAVSRSTLTRL